MAIVLPTSANVVQEQSPLAQILGPYQAVHQLMRQPELERQQDAQAAANLARTQDQARLYGSQADVAPKMAQLRMKQMQQVGQRFGPAYQFARLLQIMPAEQRSSWIAANPNKYEALVNILGSQAIPGNQNPPAGPPGQTPPGGSPTPKQATTQLGFGDIPEAKHTGPLNFNEQLQYAANRKNTPSAMNNRATASVAMESWILNNRNKFAPMINNAAQYAGSAGRGRAELQQLTNKNPQALKDYKFFNTQFVPALSNQIKKIENMGATNEQREELKQWVNQIKNIKSNPEMALAGMNNLMEMLHELAQSNFRAAEPVHPGLYTKMVGGNLWPEGNYLDVGAKPVISSSKPGELLASAKAKQNNDPLGIR